MPSAYANHLITFGGERMGKHRYAQNIALSKAGAITNGAVSGVGIWQPWLQSRAATVLALHPLAVWDNLTLTIVSGQGIFGRAVSLHVGWSHEGATVPTTHAEFGQLYGYAMRTIGGSADPGQFQLVLNAPFNETRSDVLKAANFPVGGRITLLYMFTESTFGSTQVDGERFMITANGEYVVYGQL